MKVNEPYRLDVFIAERFRCNSRILFQSSGVSFLTDDLRPLDYLAAISENAHVGFIVQVKFFCLLFVSTQTYEGIGRKWYEYEYESDLGSNEHF